MRAMGDFSSMLLPVIHQPIPADALLDLFPAPERRERSATTVYWNWTVGRRPWWRRVLRTLRAHVGR